MGISANTLELLANAGVTCDALVRIVRSIEEDIAVCARVREHVRTPAAERMKKLREKRKLEANGRTNSDANCSEHAVGASLYIEVINKEEAQTSEQCEHVRPQAPLPVPPEPLPKSKRGTRLPEDWEPTPEDVTVAYTEGLTEEEARREFANFKDHFLSSPGQRGVKLDWHRTFRKWMRKAADDKRNRQRRFQGGENQARH